MNEQASAELDARLEKVLAAIKAAGLPFDVDTGATMLFLALHALRRAGFKDPQIMLFVGGALSNPGCGAEDGP